MGVGRNGLKNLMIVFYDGLCGFCDRTVQFILDRDRAKRQFRFAALQSPLAEEILPKHGKNPKDLNTLYLLKELGKTSEVVLEKSDAAIQIFRALGGGPKFLSYLIALFPRPIRNWGYERIAKMRYRLFGKMEACRIPSAADRAQFIDTLEQAQTA